MIKRFEFLFETVDTCFILNSLECINLSDLDTLQLHLCNFKSNNSFIHLLKTFVAVTPRKRRRAVDEEAVQIPLAKGYM